jgi:tRNA(Arg) A34 adenosine deaminase TadA
MKETSFYLLEVPLMNTNPLEHGPFLRKAIALAHASRANGNHPFGAVLVRSGTVLIEAMNTVITDQDCTAHAELNLVRLASKRYSEQELADTVIYCSTEPCPMCAGAIYWSGIGCVIYGLQAATLSHMTNSGDRFSCREILERGSRHVEVIGSLLEPEAMPAHEGFWV